MCCNYILERSGTWPVQLYIWRKVHSNIISCHTNISIWVLNLLETIYLPWYQFYIGSSKSNICTYGTNLSEINRRVLGSEFDLEPNIKVSLKILNGISINFYIQMCNFGEHFQGQNGTLESNASDNSWF